MNNNLKDYKKLYFKYKTKYLQAKKNLEIQKGSAYRERSYSKDSSEGSTDSFPFLKSVSSQESLSEKPVKQSRKTPRPSTPIDFKRPESALTRALHEADERERMSEEDPKTPPSPIFEPIPLEVFLTDREEIERDIQLTIYTLAYNLLKRFEPTKIKTNRSVNYTSAKLIKCVKDFFGIAKRIINSIDQKPFRKLNQREDIANYIKGCKIADPIDFKFVLNEKKDNLLPIQTEFGSTINYEKSFPQLSASVKWGYENSLVNNDEIMLKKLLVGILI